MMLKHFVVVQKSTKQIVTEHYAVDKGQNPQFADENEWVEIEIPADAVTYYLRVACYKDKYSLMEDIAKKREYLEMRLMEQINAIRNKRNVLLKESDWTMCVDVPLSDVQKKAWQKYRQQLRDITKKVVTVDKDILWPTPPQ